MRCHSTFDYRGFDSKMQKFMFANELYYLDRRFAVVQDLMNEYYCAVFGINNASKRPTIHSVEVNRFRKLPEMPSLNLL